MVERRWPPRTRLTVAVVLGLLLVPWGGIAPISASGNPIGEIVADIASLRPAQGSDCQAVISAVQGGGIVEQDLNQAFGTNFQTLTVDSGECSVLLAFVPIVGSYNDVIVAANQYNSSNPPSVTNFYEKSFILAAEVLLVGFALDGTLYKASFHATGELNDALKLGKLRSLCGDTCYSDVLSSIYWFLNGTASSAASDFLSWAGQYIGSKANTIQNAVPEFPSSSSILVLLTVIFMAYLLTRRRTIE